MINKYNLYTNLSIKILSLVVINKDKTVNKTILNSNNGKYSFSLDDSLVDYFYFLADKSKTDYLYPSSISNDYELKFNKKINSLAINIRPISPSFKENYYFYNYSTKKYPEILKKSQKVIIYKSSYIKEKKCGLIISFDGQNVFYNNNMYKKNIYEGIQLDVLADILAKKYNKNYLILAIDNSSIYRSKELTMSNKFAPLVFNKIKNHNKDFSSSYLETYLDFIINEILPDIYSKFLVDKNDIGILGASSGGLASFYSILKYPKLFSFALSLSPAFPLFKNEDIVSFYKKQMTPIANKNKIYLYSGNISKLEKDICKSTLDIYKEIHDEKRLILRINSNAKHNEIAWRIAINEGLKKVINLED